MKLICGHPPTGGIESDCLCECDREDALAQAQAQADLAAGGFLDESAEQHVSKLLNEIDGDSTQFP